MHLRDARSLACFALLSAGVLALLTPGRARAQATGESERPRLVFLVPQLSASLRDQLQEALFAQLSLVDADLVLDEEAPNAQQQSMSERVQAARELAATESASVVLWLDTRNNGAWELHVLDARQDRVVVRSIDARGAQQSAALETVAVLTREASRAGPPASSADQTEPVESSTTEPAPPVAAAPAEATAAAPTASPEPESRVAPRSDSLRLALFYSGAFFSRETAFSHAVALGGRFDWAFGMFVGVHAGWAALIKPPAPFTIQRIPMGASLGYRIRLFDQAWADFELGLVADILQRSTRGLGPEQVATADRLRVVAAAAPRLRAEYRPEEFLGLFAGFGLDIALTPLEYKADGDSGETLLSPSFVRPALEAGVAVYP